MGWGGVLSLDARDLFTGEIYSVFQTLHSKIYYIKITKMSDAKIAEFIKKLLQLKDKSESKYT